MQYMGIERDDILQRNREKIDRMIGRYKDKEIRGRDKIVQIDRVQRDRGEQRGETVQYVQIGGDNMIQRNGKREYRQLGG